MNDRNANYLFIYIYYKLFKEQKLEKDNQKKIDHRIDRR